ncbi:Ribosomal RNA small subunit methyltransferase H [Quillaja saponaria]|nr:Ribosomal RNA small subunit methyltransferase H [Quillaja saponaria]
MDVDPVAHEKAQAQIKTVLHGDSCSLVSDLKVYTPLKNFRHIQSVVGEIDEKLLGTGVDGILMDLGMSSMQIDNPVRGFSVLGDGPVDMRMDPRASLRAEDILNSWRDAEVGRILLDYGEESNWRALQKKIVNARLHVGLHSTSDLVDHIRNATPAVRGGRQGWIKTATRVFQALEDCC